MAISVTDLYLRHHEDHDLTFTADEKNGNPLDAHNVHYMRTVEDSKKDQRCPHAGHHHFRQRHGHRRARAASHRAPRAGSAGTSFCSPASRRKARAAGRSRKARKQCAFTAKISRSRAEVINLRQFSAHAGKSELMRWLTGLPAPPRQTYLTHGEPQASAALKAKIESAFRWRVALPQYLQTVDLTRIAHRDCHPCAASSRGMLELPCFPPPIGGAMFFRRLPVFLLLLALWRFAWNRAKHDNLTGEAASALAAMSATNRSAIAMENILVSLKQLTGAPINTAFTRANGEFQFDGLANGDYIIEIR